MTLSVLSLRACLALAEARRSIAAGPEWASWNGVVTDLRNELALELPGELVFRLEIPTAIEIPRKRPVKVRVPSPKEVLDGTAPKAPGPRILRLCPTLNEYNGMIPWQKERARKKVDELLDQEKARWPHWHWGGEVHTELVWMTRKAGRVQEPHDVRTGGRRRLVRVTRCSSRRPDELSADIIGGKIPIDRLVAAQILGGDSLAWIERRAAWQPVPAGDGNAKVIVEVFELVGDAAKPRIARSR